MKYTKKEKYAIEKLTDIARLGIAGDHVYEKNCCLAAAVKIAMEALKELTPKDYFQMVRWQTHSSQLS